MVNFNIEKLLRKQGKTKYWLCKNMNITSRNLNRILKGETSSISFKYLEDMCIFLNCEIGELIHINKHKRTVSATRSKSSNTTKNTKNVSSS